MRKTRLNQVGDTIVEVLLAMIVLGVIIASAYATSGRSSTAIRASQERGEALKLIEGQIEQLRLASINEDVIVPESSFCFDGEGQLIQEPPCTFGPQDGDEEAGRYKIIINPEVTTDSRHYSVLAEWERIDGRVSDRIEIVYRTRTQ